MNTTANIILVGPPASGKTALGKHLAARLGRAFYDSDQLVEQRARLSVAEIFAQKSEACFREYEAAAIAELAKKDSIVLATGGGVVLSESNRRQLSASGVVAYLKVSVDTQLTRTADDSTRPLLKPFAQDHDRGTRLEAITQRREALYEQIADVTLNVDNKSLDRLGDELIDLLSRLNPDV